MTLSEWMSAGDLTDQKLADLIGVDRSTITRVRRGDTQPSWGLVGKIKAISSGVVTADDFLPQPIA